MHRTLSIVCFLLLVLPSWLLADDLVLIDGRYLHVKRLGATDKALRVLNLDTGGELSIPWALIREEDRKPLMVAYGLAEDETARDLYIDGIRIVMKKGDEYFGVPTSPLNEQSLPEELSFTSDGKVLTFKKEVISFVETTQIPATAAYTADQLYDQKQKSVNPAEDDLEGHLDLAKFAMNIDHYERAVFHLLKVRELDTDFQPEYIANKLSRMEDLAKNAERAKAIKLAKSEASFKRFKKAIQILDDLVTIPDLSPVLKSQAEMTKEAILKARWEYYKGVVRTEYFALLTSKLEKMSREDPTKLKLKDAQKEVRSTLHKEILGDIAAKHGLDPKEEVKKLFEERVVHQPRMASYGSGSFIVQGVAKGAKEREQALQQAMARALAQQRQNNRGGQQGSFAPAPMKFPKAPTPDEWWEKHSGSGTRKDFLEAFFAENGKVLQVVSGDQREDCSRCGATGTLPFDGQQGDRVLVTCPTCHGHKYFKVVRYK